MVLFLIGDVSRPGRAGRYLISIVDITARKINNLTFANDTQITCQKG